MTGVSTLAVNLAVSTNLSNLLDTTCPTSLSAFYTFDLSNLQSGKLSRKDVLSLLYFSGYLTIQDFDDPIIYLGFPNREVAGSFSLNLLSRYSTEDTSDFEIWVKEFRKACRNGDEKKYSYLKTESTKVLKVGISFSSETKKVSEWKCIS